MGIALDNGKAALLQAFLGELTVWNAKMNLTARGATAEDLRKHVLDSLTLLPYLDPPGAAVIDIGSGAGFPGIPVKIARPSLRMHLLEASRKKSSFLKHVIRLLHLPEVQVIHNRVEDALQEEKYRQRFDAVISRAAFSLSQLVGLGASFLRSGGTVIAMKGFPIDDELAAAERLAAATAMMPAVCHHLVLPLTGTPRTIVIYRKK